MSNPRLWVAGLLAGALWLTPALVSASQVPIPQHPEGRGENCVEDIPFMRRNHMKLLFHKRNLTMRQGIRTPTHSLKECIGCHAEPKPDGGYLPVNDPGQFCRSCHSYTGIQPDCFDCHATTPATTPATKP